ncbi:hypothetical protein HGRIS_014470 [Hohenbuehelia grisea]|uniref:HAT C-terminal dimerisation domain-containing protein n=1 Tax=Hohenbuehelia grisea TaxID=104357 RepID=A0ABR3JTM4_9AGAR
MRIGDFLVRMLRCEYEDKRIEVAGLPAAKAIEHLNAQISSYAKGLYPFDAPQHHDGSVLSWWQQLAPNPGSAVLAHCAIRIYSMTPNSMADERTASVFTWLNSAKRSAMKGSTLVRLAQLRAHYRRENEPKPSAVNRPTVKFRDMSRTIFGNPSSRNCQQKRKRAISDASVEILEETAVGRSTETPTDEDAWESEPDDGAGEGPEPDSEDDDVPDVFDLEQMSSDRLDAGEEINLGAPALLEVLSDQPAPRKHHQTPTLAREVIDVEAEPDWTFKMS